MRFLIYLTTVLAPTLLLFGAALVPFAFAVFAATRDTMLTLAVLATAPFAVGFALTLERWTVRQTWRRG